MNETISVIIPMYNAAACIGKCLDSLQKQTYNNLEIILINNASTDNTLNIVNQAAKKDSRIKVYHIDKKGVSLARNLGLEKASGRYIGFMDADDFIKPDMYEYLFKLMQAAGADISACNIFYMNKKNSKIYNNKAKNKLLSGFEALKECLENQAVFVSVWNKLYKSEVVKNITFPLLSMSEDFQFLYDVFKKDSRMICGFEPKYYYDKTFGVQDFNQRDLDSLKVFDYILKSETAGAKKERLKFFKNQYLKHLYALFIKACLYPVRVSPAPVISAAKKEYANLIFAKGISLKFKLFASVCLINKKSAKWIKDHILRN